jgi:hypothetical protein
MGRTVYNKCLDLLKLAELKFISEDQLKQLIIRFIGADLRTIKNAIKTMEKTNLIHKTKEGYNIKV